MAYNTVPLGEAATGAAYILPSESQAANRLLDTLDYNQKIDQQNQLNKQKAEVEKQKVAQDLAKSYRDNAFKAKNGTLFNNELMALQQKHIQQGSDYAKQGWDIYNPNPNEEAQMSAHDQYMADRAKLYNMQDIRDQVSKHLLDQDALASKAKIGTYNPKSIQGLHDFYSKNTLKDIVDKGLQAPYLQEAFDPQANIVGKLRQTVAMTPETEVVQGNERITSKQFKPLQTAKNIEQLIKSSNGGDDYVREQTGLTMAEANAIPDALNDIADFNDQYFRNNPQGQQALVNAGITSYSDPKYQELLQQKSAQDFDSKQKYNGLIKNYVDIARSNANEVDKRLPDFTIDNHAMSRKRLSLEEQRLRLEKEKKATADGEVIFGNQESTVPVIKTNIKGGKIVPQIVGYQKKGGFKDDKNDPDLTKPIMANSYIEPEQGATLFSQSFPQTKLIATPGTYLDLKTGHSIKNTSPFEVTAGSVKMEPVFAGLDKTDSRNGATVSKRQLEEILSGKSKSGDLKNITFKPMVYGTRPVQRGGKTVYEPVAFPYDAIRGNSKIKTEKFNKIESQLRDLINSEDYKKSTNQEKINGLFNTFEIK